MEFLLQTILSYLLLYKYVALFTVTFLAAVTLPIPSAATLMAASAFAGQGYMHISLVVVTASLGNVLGDNVGFWLARRYGKPFLYRIGFKRFLNHTKFQSAENYVEKRPGIVIFFSRFEVIMTVSVNLISGLSDMPYTKYLLYEIPGEVFQVCIYATLGYLLGSDWPVVSALIGKFSAVAMAAAVLVIAILLSRRQKRKNRQEA